MAQAEPEGSAAAIAQADRLAALERANRELAAELAALRGSASWRLTRPVRGALRVLRGGVRRASPAPEAVEGIPPEARWVLETGLFDAAFYRTQAGLGPVDDLAAAAHYVTTGEKAGIRPHPTFDPALYGDMDRDGAIAAMGLLLHYHRYGRAEGRIGSVDLDDRLKEGGRPFDPAKKTMLLACHEATRTGAPILGWNLARQFGRDLNVVLVVLYAGDLFELFAREAVFTAGPFRPKEAALLVMKRLVADLTRRYDIDFAIANSIECQPLLFGLAAHGVPSVTLVHEFASNTYPPGKMTSGLLFSTQVVFDAQVQRQAALDEWPGITTRNQHVFHQGASEVPRRPGPPPDAAERARRRDTVEAAVRGKGDRPVVLGLGTMSMRKGLDLFVSCAQAVRRLAGRDPFRFVWIGSQPKPHPEGHFCDWVFDQIKRAGLKDIVALLDEVDDLDGAFAASEVVFVPSRLDPFPNVAMDAALAGVPVVCFEGVNGFADFLAGDPATRGLAIPYLDVEAAARALIGLGADPSGRGRLGRALRERARRDFPMERYIERLAPVIEAAKTITAQERRDIATLEADDTFSASLWLNPHEKLSRAEAIRLHVRKAASGQEAKQYTRRPALGFVPQTYADHHPALNAPPFENPLAAWIRAGKPDGPWTHQVLVPGATAPGGQAPGPRTALHLHLFYPELAAPILARLAANAATPDLYVSTASQAAAADLEGRFAAYRGGSVTIRTCPNRGRDIGPMLTLFAGELQRYDVIGHLHGKRSLALTSVGLSTDLGVQWQEFLLQHLLGDRFPMADLILARFAADPGLGLVFPEDPNLTGWSLDRDLAVALAARMDPRMAVPASIDFPIGTMFWARPRALQPLFDLNLGWDDYPEEPVPIDGTMLHALERLLPVICEHAGYRFETTHVPGVTR